jgi:DNA-binding beta-propeller fold protein YncE
MPNSTPGSRYVAPRVLLIAAVATIGVGVPVAASLAQGARSGHVLVANQRSANASLIDLATDSMRFIDVGEGPHEAVIAPSGRIGVVTVYGAQTPGNELAIIDIKTGTLKRRISLGEYTRPHGAMFMPGDESRVVVTSEATQRIVLVNIESGTVEGTISTGAAGSHMVAITRDGSRAFTSDVGAGAVSEMDLAKKALVRVIPIAPRRSAASHYPIGSPSPLTAGRPSSAIRRQTRFMSRTSRRGKSCGSSTASPPRAA